MEQKDMTFFDLIGKIDESADSPKFFDLSKEQDIEELELLYRSGRIAEVIDAVPEAIEDLFKIDFPYIAPNSPEYTKTYKVFLAKLLGSKDMKYFGLWVYYPWRNALVHMPSNEHYQKLRTARNKYLITPEEQELFYGAKIGIAGLSVGSSALNSIVLSGGSGFLRIADNDTLAITNLNRLNASVCDLTRSKISGAARRIYEINPYQHFELFREGLSQENIAQFFGEGDSKLSLFVEEMDDIKLKIDARFEARKRNIPVVMATDNGDNVILDVERFDLEPDRPLFHGSVDEATLMSVPNKPNMAQRVKLASTIVGSKITPRTQHSLMLVGTKIPSWPQLGNAATFSGVAVSYAARRIVCGQPMPSGRYYLNVDEILDSEYSSKDSIAYREQHTKDYLYSLNLLFGSED